QQVREARVGSEVVPERARRHERERRVTLLERAREPLERPVLVAEAAVDERDAVGQHARLPDIALTLTDELDRLVAPARARVGEPERGRLARKASELYVLFVLGDRLGPARLGEVDLAEYAPRPEAARVALGAAKRLREGVVDAPRAEQRVDMVGGHLRR